MIYSMDKLNEFVAFLEGIIDMDVEHLEVSVDDKWYKIDTPEEYNFNFNEYKKGSYRIVTPAQDIEIEGIDMKNEDGTSWFTCKSMKAGRSVNLCNDDMTIDKNGKTTMKGGGVSVKAQQAKIINFSNIKSDNDVYIAGRDIVK